MTRVQLLNWQYENTLNRIRIQHRFYFNYVVEHQMHKTKLIKTN